eukprot:5500206-Lingulodinium_polyedra.AAC.1
MRRAASKAFWRMPRHQLEKLAKDEGLECRGASLFELVKALVVHSLALWSPRRWLPSSSKGPSLPLR